MSISKKNHQELFQKSMESLDWPRIVDRLVDHIGSDLARERARDIPLARGLEEALRLQQETTEICALLEDGISIRTGGLRDVRPQVNAAVKGEILVGQDLVNIAGTLKVCQDLKRFFAERAETCPRVRAVASRMYDLQDMAGYVGDSFTSSLELSPEMYPGLAGLRKNIHALHGRIRTRLTSLLESAELAPLAQEQYVTVRSDRYVIPLKVQARAMDLGIVHDASGSGQTVFVEPKQVVSMNNDLKIAESDLRREERRILGELSRRIAAEAQPILENVEIAAQLEVICARAQLSLELDATAPKLVDGYHMRLRQARHPILVLRGLDVVPNDLSIGEAFQALVLSGPNTGGKTVALKTMGLCALMVRAGLLIPVAPGSEVGFFDAVLTDIGDQQTVEEDLSTFSGHILRINRMLDVLGTDAASALVLLDEIAVGTDPAQGAALARGILEEFVQRGAKVVTTTHYAELKILSVKDKRFASGRVAYDTNRLCPTFRVELGYPGRSYALDIASRLGVSKTLLARARGYLAGGQRAMEDLLAELDRALSRARDEQLLLARAREKAEAMAGRYEARLEAVEQEADELRRKALADFQEEVKSAREEITRIIRDVQRSGQNRAKAAQAARDRVRELSGRIKAKAPSGPSEPDVLRKISPKCLEAGMAVWIDDLKTNGTVSSLPKVSGGMLEVLVNGLCVKVWSETLRYPRSKGQAKAHGHASRPGQGRRTGEQERPEVAVAVQREMSGGSEAASQDSWGPTLHPAPDGEKLAHAFQTSSNRLDLRGLRVDEGLDEVERFLDKAALNDESVVFIVHGHGTGAMKRAVREYLRESPYVTRFQPGSRQQGGDGATVVGLG